MRSSYRELAENLPRNFSVLIVDDCMAQRSVLRKALVDLGFKHVGQAVNGESAFRQMTHAKYMGNAYDLIICDAEMPGMNGQQLLEAVRKTKAWRELPFILLTMQSDSSTVLKAIHAGVTNYIIKPVINDLLASKILAAWLRHRGRKI